MGQYASAVQQLYVAYFSRAADPAGLAFWEGVVSSQQGSPQILQQIGEFFANSPEYLASYANKDEAAVINQVYQNLFGRAADSEGLAYWTAKLSAKALSLDNVVTEIARAAQGSDISAFQAKTSVADALTSALVAQNSFASYANDAAFKAVRDLLNAVKDDSSMAEAMQLLKDNSMVNIFKNGIAVGEPHGSKPGIAIGEPNGNMPGVAVGEPNPNVGQGIAVGEPHPGIKGIAVGEFHPPAGEVQIGIIGQANMIEIGSL